MSNNNPPFPQTAPERTISDEIARLRNACSKANEEICQTLGQALGYPWFKDYPKNFPDATEEHGVCVGDHVAETLAMEAAEKIKALTDLQAEIQTKVGELWVQVKPAHDAQQIRARLSTAFDSEKSKEQWLGDTAPDYVWSLVDIAAQWGINHANMEAPWMACEKCGTEHDAGVLARIKELENRCWALTAIIRSFHWMARRYADGRSTYAPSMLNEMTRQALSFGVELQKPHFARDGMGRSFDNLSPEDVAAAEEDMPRGHMQAIKETEARTAALVSALAESVKLQSHYATILNAYDGGKRMSFASEQEWIDRLNSLQTKEGGAA